MGLAFYQDMIALIVFSILWAFQRTMIDLDKAASTAGNSTAAGIAGSGSASDARRAANSTTATASVDTWVPTNVWHNRYLLGDEIGRQIGTLVLVGVVFALLNRCGCASVGASLSRIGCSMPNHQKCHGCQGSLRARPRASGRWRQTPARSHPSPVAT